MESPCEKKVKDIMIPIYDYPTVSGEATLKDAVKILMSSSNLQKNKPRTGRQCIFVVEDNELVGTFGIPELLVAIEPQHLKGTVFGGTKACNTWATPVFWEGLFTERCREVAGRLVREFMKPVDLFVNVNDTLLKAAYYMTKHKADTVAVKNNGRLAGMVRSIDIFREISTLVMNGDAGAAGKTSTWPWLDKMAPDGYAGSPEHKYSQA
ncbi:CBS domain-containing protein [Desulfallas sp. Bu1-1]|uniref:CBS domain-containing protein n=1 Tax=Desulfallas sp. Bu1-1 TaxID=2787620 RepID=UPI0018A06925|nr:CBS domain-containing protein [Desulfallas sp. Bu1-1]MBF7083891.1 CBS domain-containing protein [Desulfallas sp. Bu1-1]